MSSGRVKGDLLLRGAKFVLLPVDCGHLPSLHCASGTGGNLWGIKRPCSNYRHLLMLTYYGRRRARLPHFSAVELATSFLFLIHTRPKRLSLRWLSLPTFLWTELLEEWGAYSSTTKPFMWCGRIRQNLVCMPATWIQNQEHVLLSIILTVYFYIPHVQWKVLIIIEQVYIKFNSQPRLGFLTFRWPYIVINSYNKTN